MFSIRTGMLGDYFIENAVAFGDQAIAQGFKLMQRSAIAMVLLAVAIEYFAHRFNLFNFEATHEFGHVLGFSLACDRLVNGACAPNFNEKIGVERYAGQLGIGQCGQGFRQFEDGAGIAAQLAAAGAFEFVIGFIKRHRISAGSGRSAINRAAVIGTRG